MSQWRHSAILGPLIDSYGKFRNNTSRVRYESYVILWIDKSAITISQHSRYRKSYMCALSKQSNDLVKSTSTCVSPSAFLWVLLCFIVHLVLHFFLLLLLSICLSVCLLFVCLWAVFPGSNKMIAIFICPIAIAYSMGQIIKSVCVCQCISVSVYQCVSLCICPSASTLTVAFLDRFSPKLAQT